DTGAFRSTGVAGHPEGERIPGRRLGNVSSDRTEQRTPFVIGACRQKRAQNPWIVVPEQHCTTVRCADPQECTEMLTYFAELRSRRPGREHPPLPAPAVLEQPRRERSIPFEPHEVGRGLRDFGV